MMAPEISAAESEAMARYLLEMIRDPASDLGGLCYNVWRETMHTIVVPILLGQNRHAELLALVETRLPQCVGIGKVPSYGLFKMLLEDVGLTMTGGVLNSTFMRSAGSGCAHLKLDGEKGLRRERGECP
jgi:hypothetical protein